MTTNGPAVWTAVRLALLERDFPGGVDDETLLARINAAAGPHPCQSVPALKQKAHSLGLLRPPGWLSEIKTGRLAPGVVGVVWPTARDAALRAAILAGQRGQVLMAAARRHPGPDVTDAQIYYRVKAIKRELRLRAERVAGIVADPVCEVVDIDWDAAMDWGERHAPRALDAEDSADKIGGINQVRNRFGLPPFRVTARRRLAERLPDMGLGA